MGRFPFPRNERSPRLSYPAAAGAEDALRAFRAFKAEIVTDRGAGGFLRARRPDTPDGVVDSTVSEGVAYGMVIAVLFDDRELFDGLWGYALAHMNGNGLMCWYVSPEGKDLGSGGASDSDEDMAWALEMAHRQWGGGPRWATSSDARGDSYRGYALRQMERIWTFEVDHGRWADMFLPGDEWRGRDVFNPSYFAPSEYRLFAEVSGEKGFLRVVDKGYAIIEACLCEARGNAPNGLVPAWCDSSGNPVEAFPGAETNYQTDSARLPFRVGLDWALHGDERARAYLSRTSAFFAGPRADGIGADAIGDGYDLDGTPRPDRKTAVHEPGSAVFVGCAAVGAMHDPKYAAFVDEAYRRVARGDLLIRSRYYNHCWTVMSLAMMSGNFNEFPE